MTLPADSIVWDFDLRDAPFSRRCHWLALELRLETADQVVYLRTARGRVAHRTLLRIEPRDAAGTVVPITPVITPGCLRWSGPAGWAAEFALAGDSTLRLRVRGGGLRVSVEGQPYSSSLPCADGRWHLNLNAAHTRLMAVPLAGRLDGWSPPISGKSDTEPAVLNLRGAESAWAEAEISEFQSTWVAPASRSSFSAVAAEAEADFAGFLAGFAPFPDGYSDLGRRAAFVLWSNTAPADGFYAHPAIMMSQNALTGIWSWDHCFTALALAKGHPRQAWEQWWLPFAHQTSEGMLPDLFTDSGIDFGMTKPPVHGWALAAMLDDLDLPKADLERAVSALEAWTRWWLSERDDDRDGIPQYNHGCESGWDNDSICSGGIPCEAPDLTVYLILQQDGIARLHDRLGRPEVAARWRGEAEALLRRLLDHSLVDGRWVAPHAGVVGPGTGGDCLRMCWALLLGDRLPAVVRDDLLAGLLAPGRFRTTHGFATEALGSPCYREHGYWRGPIWAPSTWQVVEMLRRNGRPAEAHETSVAFLRMCAQEGFRENFDPTSGAGLCDRGFAWTAAVCLLMLQSWAPASQAVE